MNEKLEIKPSSELFLSKNQQKKMKKTELWLSKKDEIKAYKKVNKNDHRLWKEKKKEKKLFKKEHNIITSNNNSQKDIIEIKEIKENEIINLDNNNKIEEKKNEKVIEIKPNRLDKINALKEKSSQGIKLLIDCGFEDLMNDQEIVSLAKQITRAYSVNRNSNNPFNLIIYDVGSRLEKELIRNHYHRWVGITIYLSKDIINFDYLVEKISTPLLTSFDSKIKIPNIVDLKKNTVYLTGDSTNEIETLEKDKIYIIGGIVDRNRHKLLTLKKSEQLNITHAKLPIDHYLHLNSSKILATNHVVEILAHFNSVKNDWKEAFCSIIPKRKLD